MSGTMLSSLYILVYIIFTKMWVCSLMFQAPIGAPSPHRHWVHNWWMNNWLHLLLTKTSQCGRNPEYNSEQDDILTCRRKQGLAGKGGKSTAILIQVDCSGKIVQGIWAKVWGPWCWERLRAGEGGNRGRNGWMAPPTQQTWVWANSGR